jgi:adenylate kinase family enzyme
VGRAISGVFVRRIVILGNAGSGKSTLARGLGKRLSLPVTHLDVLFWRPGWVEPDNEGFRERVAASVAGDAWISEGNYATRTFDLRIPRADTVIWLNTPRLTCAWRILWRSTFERQRADLAEGCEENILSGDFTLFQFAWHFDHVSRPRIQEKLSPYLSGQRIIDLSGAKAVTALLLSLGERP